MADFRHSIDGWDDAIRDERDAHEDSFANPFDEICGVPIRHLSLVDIARLGRMRNRFFDGDFPTEAECYALPAVRADAIAFLIYQHLRPSSNVLVCMYRRFKYRKIDIESLFIGIFDMINSTYMDRAACGGGGGSSTGSSWSVSADYVDLFGAEYGWTADYTLNYPYRKLIQCVRRIQRRNNPDATFSSPASSIVTRWMDQKNSK